ncbi:MAG TPA: hypothetical protein VK982_07635, partial [Bacteroidales bacterium]|nr:hypothetical protein [Bacteroidales bacterium]
VSHLEDKYTGKAVKESIARVKKESNKFMNMIEGGLDKKQIKKLESRIMFLNKYLNNKDVSVFTSTALAIVDGLKKYMKDKKLKQCQILETRLMSLHKKVDTKFDKLIFDDYIDADRTVTAWREY